MNSTLESVEEEEFSVQEKDGPCEMYELFTIIKVKGSD